MNVIDAGRRGGKASARRMTREQRSERAKKAAAARWKGHKKKQKR